MLNKIKFLGIIFLSILLFTNCNKEAKQDPTALGEITFAALDINPDKDYDTTMCVDGIATYARVNIDDVLYYPAVFIIDGQLKTQSIKLPSGCYMLKEFSLIDGKGTEDMADDVVLKSTPMTGSPFAQYVSYGLEHEICVVAFEKHEIYIDVLCYIPIHFEDFGFFWWDVRALTIRTQCFFGDFCIEHLPDYEGSLYAIDGVQMDEVAIFKIVATRNGDPIGTFHNTYWDENEEFAFKSPLCVEYADYDNEPDQFKFELWIYVKVGDEFKYVLFHTWDFMDAEKIDTGGDGIVEFVLGDCVYSETDLLLPPYINQYFTGIDTPVSVIDDGDTTYYDDGSILIEGYISEFYEQADDWRVRGISIWYITFPFAPDGSATPFGTAEIFVGADPDNSAYTGKWDIVHSEVLTPTDVGFDILGHTVGIGVEGDVLGLYAKWTYTMSFDYSDPSTFVYYFTGYINSQVPFEL